MTEEKGKQHYQGSNFDVLVLTQNNMIIDQLKEMNYYMALIAKEDKSLPDFMEKDNG